MQVNEVGLALTRHAIQRMVERGCNPDEVVSFLLRNKGLILLRNHQGYEICIPFKGRLVGDFDRGTLIIKSFLIPLRFGEDYRLNGRKSRDGYVVRVSSVSFPN